MSQIRKYAIKRTEITPEILQELFVLSNNQGKLVWKKRTPDMFKPNRRGEKTSCSVWNGIYADKEAFTCIGNNGYLQGRVFDFLFLAHRVVWALSYGKWPTKHIDHIDGNKTNNTISNLREVDDLENAKNQKRHIDNKSGVTGVCFDKRAKKWAAFITSNGKRSNLGLFSDISSAICARKNAEKNLGFSPNHGRAA